MLQLMWHYVTVPKANLIDMMLLYDGLVLTGHEEYIIRETLYLIPVIIF